MTSYFTSYCATQLTLRDITTHTITSWPEVDRFHTSVIFGHRDASR